MITMSNEQFIMALKEFMKNAPKKVKFEQLSFETKQCPTCKCNIDISMNYAFDNEKCPYCGQNW